MEDEATRGRVAKAHARAVKAAQAYDRTTLGTQASRRAEAAFTKAEAEFSKLLDELFAERSK